MINALFVSAVLFLMGLYLIVSNEKTRRRAVAAASWPLASALIVESRVHHARPRMDESDFMTFMYVYTVEGVNYVGKSVDLFESEKNAIVEELDEFARRYPEGSQVDVYYDPVNPRVSTIETGQRMGYARARNFGLFLIGVALVVAIGGAIV